MLKDEAMLRKKMRRIIPENIPKINMEDRPITRSNSRGSSCAHSRKVLLFKNKTKNSIKLKPELVIELPSVTKDMTP